MIFQTLISTKALKLNREGRKGFAKFAKEFLKTLAPFAPPS